MTLQCFGGEGSALRSSFPRHFSNPGGDQDLVLIAVLRQRGSAFRLLASRVVDLVPRSAFFDQLFRDASELEFAFHQMLPLIPIVIQGGFGWGNRPVLVLLFIHGK